MCRTRSEQELGGRYQRTRVVLFRDAIESACGSAESATGPFYCPGDQKVYFDVGFFDELTKRFGAPGEFAEAYVIGHELGHHVQHLLGLDENTRGAAAGANSASVALSSRLIVSRASGSRRLAERQVQGGRGSARSRRCRRRAARGSRNRRRSSVKDGNGARDARAIHAWHVGTTCAGIWQGDELGRSARLRHRCARHLVPRREEGESI